MTEQLKKTLELIKKLLAKAASAERIGNAAEAAAFAAKANELCLKHKLELGEVELSESVEEAFISENVVTTEPLGQRASKKMSAWQTGLLHAIAQAHFCRTVAYRNSKVVNLMGRGVDVALVKYLYAVLAREGERLGNAHYHEARGAARKAGLAMPDQPKRAFLIGYVVVIARRLREMRDTVEQQGGPFAIVRFNQADEAADAFQQQRHPKTSLTKHKMNGDRASFEAGKRAGERANLNPGVGSDTAPTPGTLGRGAALLGPG